MDERALDVNALGVWADDASALFMMLLTSGRCKQIDENIASLIEKIATISGSGANVGIFTFEGDRLRILG